MELLLIVFLAFGLAMDAFAVSLTNGMCYKMPLFKNALYWGLAFGVAQAVMPLIGYFAGHSFSSFVSSIDHWLALILLGFIGGKMAYESIKELRNPQTVEVEKRFSGRVLSLQAIATSIDALAVGITLGVMQVDLFVAVGIIGLITFLCSFIGVLIGSRFGQLFQGKAELLGGAILIFIGVRIFFEHMEFFYF